MSMGNLIFPFAHFVGSLTVTVPEFLQFPGLVHAQYVLLQQGVTSKSSSSEVEIIRYQVLIPVTEVQVRASSAKDMDSHFLWELIHLRSQLQRRSEKVYVLSNRWVSAL